YKPAYRMGGPILSVSATAERLAKKGHEVIVFTTNSNLDVDLDVPVNRPRDVDGVQVWYFEHQEPIKKYLPFIPYFSKSMGFLYAPAMRAELDRVVPTVDLVHTHLPYIYPTLAAGKSALRNKRPLFYHQRGVFDPERLKFRGAKKRLYIKAIERPLMRRATTLIALTEAEVDSYRALGVETPCRVIPNGVDLADPPTLETRASGPFGFPEDEPVILFMARLHPIKGADKLIRAFLLIHKEFPKARLVMAGPDEWGIVEKFRREIAAADAGDRVLFPGMVSGDAKRQLLARADLFCLPSDAEGFSVAVLEALAHSTAVLLSPGCHFPEAQKAGAARVADPDPESWARELASLLKAPQKLQEMGRKGRALVERHYSWDAITDRLEAVYLEGIERSRLGHD
ncbi:MAG TPA: glycosyltransferase, partial [Acidobacteriota bacterium]|nr:glycosyltransferase [Acidobacteriota bacterium]